MRPAEIKLSFTDYVKAPNKTLQEDLFAAPLAPSPAAKTPIKPENPVAESPVMEAAKTPAIYSVSEISNELRESLKNNFALISVRGEIADFKGIHRSGHLYFALKDDKSQLRAVMWRPALQKVPFEIKGGQEVIVQGRVDYYPAGGSLQLVVERMEPVGLGALQLKLEQLKEKLKAEGLFELSRKRPIRPLNWRIGIVTSKTTAALQDMLRIYKSRFPLAEIFLFHAAVQGEKAPAEVVAALERAQRFSKSQTKPLDVLILTRGGGSYEDLFCFNDELIVRALARSTIPTVSAIGHEIDTTLSDLVADKRSATPSHAAQETVPEAALWIERLQEIQNQFERQILEKISDYQQRVDVLGNRFIAAAPQKRIENQKLILKEKKIRISNLIQRALETRQFQIRRVAGLLDALSPLKVLDRGYSVVRLEDSGQIVKDIQDLSLGQNLQIQLSRGKIGAKITEKISNP